MYFIFDVLSLFKNWELFAQPQWRNLSNLLVWFNLFGRVKWFEFAPKRHAHYFPKHLAAGIQYTGDEAYLGAILFISYLREEEKQQKIWEEEEEAKLEKDK